MADVFREVDEDLRQERYLKLWRRYRYWLFGFLVAALGGAVAYVMISDARESSRVAEAQQFAAAERAFDDGHLAEAADMFGRLASNSEAGISVIAGLAEADARASSGNLGDAVSVYDRIASDNRVDPLYQNLAALLAVKLLIDRVSLSEINSRLVPLMQGESQWRGLATELSGLAELRAGNEVAARAIFSGLVVDPTSTPTLRTRAAELLESIGGSVEEAISGVAGAGLGEPPVDLSPDLLNESADEIE